MNRKAVKQLYKEHWETVPYQCIEWDQFNYDHLKYVMWEKPAGRGSSKTFNDVFIMADTETSKSANNTTDKNGKIIPVYNKVVAFSISLLAYDRSLVTLYGHRPDDLISCITKIQQHLKGSRTIIYFHNLSYDWVFIRQFCFSAWGHPVKQLNTKPHYPILIDFANGIQFRDSLILAQRTLEKWAIDMDVEHKKAVGYWDYDKLRTQSTEFLTDEITYIEHDTLAGVECLNALRKQLKKHVYSMPYTATGIPREEVRKIGKLYNAHDRFTRQALTAEQQIKMESIYHGGYTHANRHVVNQVIDHETITCYDFASSYPYCMLTEKMPSEKFMKYSKPLYIPDLLSLSDKYAFAFTLIGKDVDLKSPEIAMPYLQGSKCTKTVNAIYDNGRILCADLVEIPLTELDLQIIADQYDFHGGHVCIDIEFANKDYLPKWFRDYIYQCFEQKTVLKGGDPVAYGMAKAKVNSLYGMCVQKPVKDNIIENYATGENDRQEVDFYKVYNKFIKKFNSILPYQWGTWVTAAAARNLHELGKCISDRGQWLYSDTDSVYAYGWDQEKIEKFNLMCKEKLTAAGYGAVNFKGREYWLGIAEKDGEYTEFITQGAKRYCCREKESGKLKITVAGVPKKTGAACLNDDINNFKPGFIFPGAKTGKLTHYYIFINDIRVDHVGDVYADSVDLCPCDYLLDSCYSIPWDAIEHEEIEVKVFEE